MSEPRRTGIGHCTMCAREAIDQGELCDLAQICNTTMLCADHVRFAADSFAVDLRADMIRDANHRREIRLKEGGTVPFVGPKMSPAQVRESQIRAMDGEVE